MTTADNEVDIVWSRRALQRLQEIRAFISRDKPEAAARLATRITVLVAALRTQPHLGRTGAAPDIRELIVGGTPYVILYRVQGTRVMIETIYHTRRREHR